MRGEDEGRGKRRVREGKGEDEGKGRRRERKSKRGEGIRFL